MSKLLVMVPVTKYVQSFLSLICHKYAYGTTMTVFFFQLFNPFKSNITIYLCIFLYVG